MLTAFSPRHARIDPARRPAASGDRRRLLHGLATLLAATALPVIVHARPRRHEEISWEDLVPKDWDPMKSFEDVAGLPGLADLPDTDVRVQELYERLRKVWDDAPTVHEMNGRSVKLPGYLVPLESGKTGIREFLLVPYFGACIHTPPPPANQIIHVRSTRPLRGLRTMDAIWVSGTLQSRRASSDMGVSGYELMADEVVEFKAPD
jgi:hypothetical protein